MKTPTAVYLLPYFLLFALNNQVAAQPEPQTYINREAGLEMTYPGTWQVLQKSDVDKALASAEGVDQPSQQSSEETSYLALTLVKKRQVEGVAQNATAGVVVVPLPPEQAETFDVDAQVQSLMAAAREVPGAEVTADALPLANNPSVRSFTTRTSVGDRMATQYQYIYWRAPHFVQISFSVSNPDDENEVKEIIRSIKIDESGTAVSP
jgi:hypothetical protein